MKRLESAWIFTADELYARICACEFSKQESTKQAMTKELEIETKALAGFKKYIEPHVSPDVLKAQKPREYPLGLKI